MYMCKYAHIQPKRCAYTYYITSYFVKLLVIYCAIVFVSVARLS